MGEIKCLRSFTPNERFVITEFYGDKAYFRKPILDLLKEDKVETIIPISASVYKIDDTKFSYNKESDQFSVVSKDP
ncbi:hypothetical protein PIPA1_45670 [Pelosinus sp. IPA-1]|nr:hypothetical protein PIPA1_45670 [Pelosinus sp. IPA-1]